MRGFHGVVVAQSFYRDGFFVQRPFKKVKEVENKIFLVDRCSDDCPFLVVLAPSRCVFFVAHDLPHAQAFAVDDFKIADVSAEHVTRKFFVIFRINPRRADLCENGLFGQVDGLNFLQCFDVSLVRGIFFRGFLRLSKFFAHITRQIFFGKFQRIRFGISVQVIAEFALKLRFAFTRQVRNILHVDFPAR